MEIKTKDDNTIAPEVVWNCKEASIEPRKLTRRNFIKIGGVAAISIGVPFLSSCSAGTRGVKGGLFSGFLQTGIRDDCTSISVSSGDKVIEIDGTEIKLPVDWNYAHTIMGDSFVGNNWNGDDSVRGIGLFNYNEEGDNSEEYANSYAVNVRWEYSSYSYTEGTYTTHASYTATSSSGVTVGGTSASCTNIGAGKNKEVIATRQAKIVVYNPENGLACVCAPGFCASSAFTGTSWEGNCNWGGSPLALLGGITTAVSDALGITENNILLELYFVDPDTELGPCEFAGGSLSSSRNKCSNTVSIDNSSISALAVSVAFDENRPTYAGHEVVYKGVCGNGSSCDSDLPTTEAAILLRETIVGDSRTADCGMFVASVIQATVDASYPSSSTSTQYDYCANSSDYEEVLSGVTPGDADDDQLSPGDIFITEPGETGHTFIYTGSDAIQEQFTYADDSYKHVSASLCEYGPKIKKMAGDSRNYSVFRFVGEENPSPAAANL